MGSLKGVIMEYFIFYNVKTGNIESVAKASEIPTNEIIMLEVGGASHGKEDSISLAKKCLQLGVNISQQVRYNLKGVPNE